MTKPITPNEVSQLKQELLPEPVIAVINSMIAKNYSSTSRSSRFTQDELVEEMERVTRCSRNEIFDNHWLDFEDVYEAHGWKVKYDKPAYNESYAASFTFLAKRGRHDDPE